jgi:multiple sugar transport system permease protein
VSRRAALRTGGLWLATLLFLFFALAPLIWMVDSSLQHETDLLTRPTHLWPRQATLANFAYIFTGAIPPGLDVSGLKRISEEAREVPQALVNSVVVAVSVAVVNVVLGALAAYSFARLRFHGRRTAFNVILASRLLPAIAVAIPYYAIINAADLLDTYTGLILVYLTFTLPFTVWFLRDYFMALPVEIEEAALIDGCSRLQVLRRIVVPLAAPGLAAAAAFAFMFSYNEFLFALLLTQTISSQTLPVILASVATNPNASLSLTAASVVVAMAPPVIFAVVFQRFLTRGLVAAVGHA